MKKQKILFAILLCVVLLGLFLIIGSKHSTIKLPLKTSSLDTEPNYYVLKNMKNAEIFFKGPDGNYSTTNKDIGVYPDYLSIVACFKNEAPYLKEWIEYHHMLGVDRFYLYNNESDDNFMEVLRPYINSGLVIYTNWPGKVQQIPIYADAIKKIKDKTRWAAIIDIDEFILPMEVDSIPELLKDYEDYGALAMFWRGFDSNGHVQKPDGLVIENYTRTYQGDGLKVKYRDWPPVGEHVKSTVNPRFVNNPLVHSHELFNTARTVDENKKIVLGYGYNTGYNTQQKIRVNHYASKSLQEYIKKWERGEANFLFKQKFESTKLNFPETQQDTTILRFLPELKRRIR